MRRWWWPRRLPRRVRHTNTDDRNQSRPGEFNVNGQRPNGRSAPAPPPEVAASRHHRQRGWSSGHGFGLSLPRAVTAAGGCCSAGGGGTGHVDGWLRRTRRRGGGRFTSGAAMARRPPITGTGNRLDFYPAPAVLFIAKRNRSDARLNVYIRTLESDVNRSGLFRAIQYIYIRKYINN